MKATMQPVTEPGFWKWGSLVKVGYWRSGGTLLPFTSLFPFPPPIPLSPLSPLNRIWRILALKSDIWWRQFCQFSRESLLTTVYACFLLPHPITPSLFLCKFGRITKPIFSKRGLHTPQTPPYLHQFSMWVCAWFVYTHLCAFISQQF